MIRLENLTKRYGNHLAVDDLSLEVPSGELFGFLGPNGAGKTTTIKMIAGLLIPTSGRIELAGHDLEGEPEQAKAALGFIPDRPFLYEKLSATEFLRFVAGLYGIDGNDLGPLIEGLLELVELSHAKADLVESFSHGMKQRLVMASSFIHDPAILVVDEPMVGLDPKGARLIKGVFRERCNRGATIFMSTHTLEVAEEMCDRIGIISGGRLIALGTMDELRDQASSHSATELEPIFLKLTGGEGFRESDQGVA
jgi:ABC-2 type transport system ATP-binding protein